LLEDNHEPSAVADRPGARRAPLASPRPRFGTRQGVKSQGAKAAYRKGQVGFDGNPQEQDLSAQSEGHQVRREKDRHFHSRIRGNVENVALPFTKRTFVTKPWFFHFYQGKESIKSTKDYTFKGKLTGLEKDTFRLIFELPNNVDFKKITKVKALLGRD
jgi:hypothetical protein